VSDSGFSLSALELELDELRKDLTAFGSAYAALCQRVQESNEVVPPRRPELHTWSGTRSVVGGLEMAIHSIERTIVEYGELINKVRSGEVSNLDAPARPILSLVKESDKL
jgi:hypothetical protein